MLHFLKVSLLLFRHSTPSKRSLEFRYLRSHCLNMWLNLLLMTSFMEKMVREIGMCPYNNNKSAVFHCVGTETFKLLMAFFFFVSGHCRAAIYLWGNRKWKDFHHDGVSWTGWTSASLTWHDLQQYRTIPGQKICKSIHRGFCFFITWISTFINIISYFFFRFSRQTTKMVWRFRMKLMLCWSVKGEKTTSLFLKQHHPGESRELANIVVLEITAF